MDRVRAVTKFFAMQNPFKDGDAVLTKVKGKEVQATVRTVWRNEVQVKTADGDLLWRSMYTVWRTGEAPLAREPKRKETAAVKHQAAQSRPPKGKKSPSKSKRRKRR